MGMLNPELVPRVVERLRALADETRIGLLLRLREGPANVAALARALEAAQPSVSKHLAVLKAAGLVGCTREGTQSVYAIADDSIWDLCSVLCDGVKRHLEAERAAIAAQLGRK